MHLFVLGATGRTGAQLLDLALARGHDVTAFVRSPHKLARDDARLRIVRGDPRDASALAAAMPGHDAVLSALGPTPREAFTRTTLLRDCAATTCAAMRESGVRRLGIVSSAALYPGGGLIAAVFRALFRAHVEDLRAMEAVVASADVDWTIVRPPRLVGSGGDAYRTHVGGMPEGGSASGSVATFRAVAALLVDDAEQRTFTRETVAMCR